VAPETVGARSDLYGLGAVAYFLLRGSPVFHGRSVVEVCSHHLHTAPEPLSVALGGAISAELEGIVLECLAKDPAERPASASELRHRLADCLVPSAPLPWLRESELRESEVVRADIPCCLAFMRSQRMLERLEAVLCGAEPTEGCRIAA
jgi:serine/threonine protein kinase